MYSVCKTLSFASTVICDPALFCSDEFSIALCTQNGVHILVRNLLTNCHSNTKQKTVKKDERRRRRRASLDHRWALPTHSTWFRQRLVIYNSFVDEEFTLGLAIGWSVIRIRRSLLDFVSDSGSECRRFVWYTWRHLVNQFILIWRIRVPHTWQLKKPHRQHN